MTMLSLFVPLLFGVQVIFSMDVTIEKTNCEKAFDALLMKFWHYCGHEDFCNLAKVNKSLRESVLNSASERKKVRLDLKECPSDFFESRTSNMYASVCNRAVVESPGKNSILRLERHSFCSNYTLRSNNGEWHNFIPVLSNYSFPTATNEGIVEFYGCGYKSNFLKCFDSNSCVEVASPEIFQYRLLPGAIRQMKECRVSFDENSENNHYSVTHFLDFPILLHALLNSSKITEKIYPLRNSIRIYHLNGVELPTNYTKHELVQGKYNSFNELPVYIKNPIVNHYNFCKNRVKKTNDNKKEILFTFTNIPEINGNEYALKHFSYNFLFFVRKPVNSKFLSTFKKIQYWSCDIRNQYQDYQHFANKKLELYGGMYLPHYDIIVCTMKKISLLCTIFSFKHTFMVSDDSSIDKILTLL